jgi:hypothetical protein
MIGHFATVLRDENQNHAYPFNWIYQSGYKDPTVITLVGCIMSFEGKSGVVFISICMCIEQDHGDNKMVNFILFYVAIVSSRRVATHLVTWLWSKSKLLCVQVLDTWHLEKSLYIHI